MQPECGKKLNMGLFTKIVIVLYTNSITLELTLFQIKLDRPFRFEIWRFLYAAARIIEMKKLWSICVAMRVHAVSEYHA